MPGLSHMWETDEKAKLKLSLDIYNIITLCFQSSLKSCSMHIYIYPSGPYYISDHIHACIITDFYWYLIIQLDLACKWPNWVRSVLCFHAHAFSLPPICHVFLNPKRWTSYSLHNDK